MTDSNQKQLGKTLWNSSDCLASHDELIAAQDQKLNPLETHKKGLM